MRPSSALAVGLAVLFGVTMQPAHAQNAIYLATYVEVVPASVETGRALLRQYGEASRRDAGNRRFELLQEIGRANRFVLLETWSDQSALDAHKKAAHTAQFGDRLASILSSPNDERVNNPLYVGPADAVRAAGAVYAVTHVDVIPPRKDDCVALLQEMSEASRKESGNQTYEVWQQSNRSNHFTVAETWKDGAALDAHQTAAHTRRFRAQLAPMAGALYDERLYRSVQ
ncbi:MAG: putative quinol monooxygenase [Xanthobacteraceae bacterium]